MDSSNATPFLDHYQLTAVFDGTSVTHRAYKSDVLSGIRKEEVITEWVRDERLGTGTFGVVWRQREKRSGELRAVKIVSKEHVSMQEVDALVELRDHPHLFVRFLGWFQDHDTIHIAMEYIAYGDLGEFITRNGARAKCEAQAITAQILEGLIILHEREICHRDLKPQNILIASLSPMWVKITDFGIAKRWSGTYLKTHCGTVNYQAPEMLGFLPRKFRRESNEYTNDVDIWALGAVVHQMLTSEIPFLDKAQHTNWSSQDVDFGRSSGSITASVDYDLLIDYCRELTPFPTACLSKHGISRQGVNFIQSLMIANPSGRVSATRALKDEWLEGVKLRITDSTGPPLTTGERAQGGEKAILHKTSITQELRDPPKPAQIPQQVLLDEGPIVTIEFATSPSPFKTQAHGQNVLKESSSPSSPSLDWDNVNWGNIDNAKLRWQAQIEAHCESQPSLRNTPVLLIALVGPMGSGKSYFAKLCTEDSSITAGDEFWPVTRSVRGSDILRVSDRLVQLVDTPGFPPCGIQYFQMLNMVNHWMNAFWGAGRRLYGIIYIERLFDHTCYSIATEVFRCLVNLCAPNILGKSVLLTAKWDQIAGSEEQKLEYGRHEQELVDSCWKELLEGGAIFARSYGTRNGCMRIIEHVVQKQLTTPNRQKGKRTDHEKDEKDEKDPVSLTKSDLVVAGRCVII